MFSVIIPLYNKASYIEKAVQSILSQTFKGYELIIVNDGSTDNSLEIVQQLNNSTIQQFNIINQSNSGVSTARNNGVKASKYDYIAFLDADDWWEPDYLYQMKQFIENYKQAGLWAAKYFKVKNGKNIEANIGLKNNFIMGYIDYFKVYGKTMWMPFYAPSVIIHKNILLEFNGFKPNLKLGEDFDLWVRIALKYNIAYLNKPLVFYNQDVELKNRAVNSNKVYAPKNNFIFQLSYLKNEENKNPSLKQLLDNIRVYNLMNYHIFRKYQKETKEIIKQVDFKNQPRSVRLKYALPVIILKQYYYIRKLASIVKTQLKSFPLSLI